MSPRNMDKILAISLIVMNLVVYISACESINISLCRDVSYTMTGFPNTIGHTTQEEAEFGLIQSWPLVMTGCSPVLKEFLCELYVPKCWQFKRQPIVLPSRQLCEMAQDGCEPLYNQFGSNWPQHFKCDNFPRASCEPIRVPLCMREGHEMTVFPNRFGHINQHEAGIEVHQLVMFVEAKCSHYLRDFLCFAYFRRCDKEDYHVQRTNLSRNMCEAARAGCEPLMNAFNYPWPKKLNCENFHDEEKM